MTNKKLLHDCRARLFLHGVCWYLENDSNKMVCRYETDKALIERIDAALAKAEPAKPQTGDSSAEVKNMLTEPAIPESLRRAEETAAPQDAHMQGQDTKRPQASDGDKPPVYAAAPAMRLIKRFRNQRDDICDHLRWILPMAKGYAHEHLVGGNAAKVADAEKALAAIPTREQQVKNIMDFVNEEPVAGQDDTPDNEAGEISGVNTEPAPAAAPAWAMRPREPTEEMHAAANREWDGRMSARSAGVWQAMFDAAPTAIEPVLPCELVVGAGHFHKGVSVSTVQGCIDRMHAELRRLQETYEPLSDEAKNMFKSFRSATPSPTKSSAFIKEGVGASADAGTPETDEAEYDTGLGAGEEPPYDMVVASSTARTFERERNALRTENVELKRAHAARLASSDGASECDVLLSQRDALRAELEAVKRQCETLRAQLHGMQDGAYLRDTLTANKRLGAELDAARRENAESQSRIDTRGEQIKRLIDDNVRFIRGEQAATKRAEKAEADLAALHKSIESAGEGLPDVPKGHLVRISLHDYDELRTAATLKIVSLTVDAERWRKLLTLITGYSMSHYSIDLPPPDYANMKCAEQFTTAIDAARGAEK